MLLPCLCLILGLSWQATCARGLFIWAFMCFWGLAVCHHASYRCLSASRWPYVVFLAALCRIGEACNPGPDSDFVIGTFNPSGLRGKAPYIVSHLAFGDIWAVTETHLSCTDVHAFRAGLSFARVLSGIVWEAIRCLRKPTVSFTMHGEGLPPSPNTRPEPFQLSGHKASRLLPASCALLRCFRMSG